MSNESTTTNYRLIWGWSAYQDFSTIEEARQVRDEMLAKRRPVDPLYRTPAIFTQDENGHYLTEES